MTLQNGVVVNLCYLIPAVANQRVVVCVLSVIQAAQTALIGWMPTEFVYMMGQLNDTVMMLDHELFHVLGN